MKECPNCGKSLVPKGKFELKLHVQTFFSCRGCGHWFHVYKPLATASNPEGAGPEVIHEQPTLFEGK